MLTDTAEEGRGVLVPCSNATLFATDVDRVACCACCRLPCARGRLEELALLTTVTIGIRQVRSDLELATGLPASRRSVDTGGDLETVSWILTRTLLLPA